MDREGRAWTRGSGGGGGSCSTGSQPDFLLQWGNRKRLRCIKIQVKGAYKTTIRRVVRSDKDSKDHHHPPQPPLLPRPSPHRVLRNSESSAVAMRSPQRQANNGYGHVTSSDRGGGGNTNHRTNGQVAGASGISNGVAMSEEDKKVGGGGGSSSCGSERMVWPKFIISLSNREKEEDFMVFKGCNKLPQRPKKRAKCIQRTLNLVCPGSWLCDLTQERYEVREKKVSKKRPRGLKAMGSMDTDSE